MAAKHPFLVDDLAGAPGAALIQPMSISVDPGIFDPGLEPLAAGPGDDLLIGSDSRSILEGFGGNDVILGGGGGDELYGGDGADRIFGETGSDWLASGNRNRADTTRPVAFPDDGTEYDQLYGGDGDDRLTFGYGDLADGGAGIDRLYLSLAGADHGVTVNTLGLGGSDWDVDGTLIRYVEQIGEITGTSFDDRFWLGPTPVQSDDMVVNGGEGGDIFGDNGGTNWLKMNGGAGNDRWIASEASRLTSFIWVHFNGGDGVDTLDFRNMLAGVDVDIQALRYFHSNVENIDGSAFDDEFVGSNLDNVIQGMDGDDVIFGVRGADVLVGGNGNDRLDGGFDADYMVGGLGDDTYVIDEVMDRVIELAGEGTDTIRVNFTYSLRDVIENLTLYGTTAIDGFGNGSGNVITGNGAANKLYSGSGTDDHGADIDSLSGGGGDDLLSIGYGDSADGGAGRDGLRISLRGATTGVTLDMRALTEGQSMTFAGGTLTGIEYVAHVTGTAFSDQFLVHTQSGLLTLEAGDGDDVVSNIATVIEFFGGNGDDRFISGSGGDYVDGGAGVDTVDYRNASGGLWVQLEGAAPGSAGFGGGDTLVGIERVDGSAFADVIIGDANDNVLQGMDGDDTLRGGDGSDSLAGGNGADTLTGGAGADWFTFTTAPGAGQADT
ncbi:calcium-binding protein, partial [Sphingomonas sp.]|uniref:calcium-binding protein n=1 Tax=Sphingomonas sp. TaxID=28214 RepID=UPI0031D664C8